jgi:hypothetical protein
VRWNKAYYRIALKRCRHGRCRAWSLESASLLSWSGALGLVLLICALSSPVYHCEVMNIALLHDNIGLAPSIRIKKVNSSALSPAEASSFLSLLIRPPGRLLQADADFLDETSLLHGSKNLRATVTAGRLVINPCLATIHGTSYYVAREHMKLGLKENNWWSNIVHGQFLASQTHASNGMLNSNSTYMPLNIQFPLAIAKCLFKQPGHFLTGPADPRLFAFKGELWVSFSFYSLLSPELSRSSSSSCDEMSSYSGAVWIQKLDAIGSAVELASPYPKSTVEKNWIFFSPRKFLETPQLLAVVSVEPHVVLSVSIESGVCKEEARTSANHLFDHIAIETRIHLGAIPARLSRTSYKNGMNPQLRVLQRFGGVQLGMFHTKEANYVYKHFFYLFSEIIPYDVLCVSLSSVAPPRKSGTSFETSIQVDEEAKIATVSFGVDDAGGGVAAFKLSQILDMMKCGASTDLPMQSLMTGEAHSERKLGARRLSHIRYSSLQRSSLGFFNPSVLVLPRNSLYPFVVVARAPPIKRHFHGLDSSKIWDVTISRLVSCVLDVSFSCVGSTVYLDLPAPRRAIENRLTQRIDTDLSFNYDSYVGAEDGRLTWSAWSRQVLLTYGMNSETTNTSSRNVWIVDLSEVYPFLKTVLSPCRQASHSSRSMFSVPTELVYRSARVIEKNWIIFEHNAMLFVSYSLLPRVILKPRPLGLMSEMSVFQDDAFAAIDFVNNSVNQGTGVIRVKLCLSSQCCPNAEERFVAIFHTRNRHALVFKHYLVVYNAHFPFHVDTVTLLTDFDIFWTQLGESKKFVYAVSLDFMESFETARSGTHHGDKRVATLDSIGIIGIGVDDVMSYVFTTSILSLLHTYIDSRKMKQ